MSYCENRISREMGVFQELTTHVCKNHVENDIYRVDNAGFHSVGMDGRLSYIMKDKKDLEDNHVHDCNHSIVFRSQPRP